MYESLYSTLISLVKAKKSGTLRIDHENGAQAYIYLKKGRVEGIENGGLTGQKAGKALAMWISFSTDFSEQEPILSEHIMGLDTEPFLDILSKVEKKATQIQMTIPLNGVKFKMELSNLEGGKKFNSKELKVALALDGKTPVKKVVSDSGVPDFEALYYLYGFCRQGLIKKVATNIPLAEEVRASFMESLTDIVSDLVGPVAEIIINDAFEYLDSEPGLIYQSELPQLIEAIGRRLDDDDDSITFKKWGLNILKSF